MIRTHVEKKKKRICLYLSLTTALMKGSTPPSTPTSWSTPAATASTCRQVTPTLWSAVINQRETRSAHSGRNLLLSQSVQTKIFYSMRRFHVLFGLRPTSAIASMLADYSKPVNGRCSPACRRISGMQGNKNHVTCSVKDSLIPELGSVRHVTRTVLAPRLQLAVWQLSEIKATIRVPAGDGNWAITTDYCINYWAALVLFRWNRKNVGFKHFSTSAVSPSPSSPSATLTVIQLVPLSAGMDNNASSANQNTDGSIFL